MNTTTTTTTTTVVVVVCNDNNDNNYNNNDNNLNVAMELKKLWNMKVMFILIMIGALGTVTEGLIQRLEDLEIRRRVETIQTTTLLRSARILKGVLVT